MPDTTNIKSIDKDTIHRITSGQVVVDLATAVKELVENSLDAGASNIGMWLSIARLQTSLIHATEIEVKFKDQGLTSIEVIDDGTGINKADYASVARKHHTSKIAQLSDLMTVQTFGFRGEALASLCAMCERVTITTATAEEAPMGTVLQFARSGELESSTKKTARQRGTTVLVEKLFAPLPVRRRELERMIKRDYARALQLMQAYALVPCVGGSWPSLEKRAPRGVRLTVSNQSGKGARQNQVQSAPLAQPNVSVDPIQRLRANLSLVWGPKTLEQVIPLDLEFTISPEKSVLRRLSKKQAGYNEETTIRVRGLISKFSHMSGRLTSERQFYYLNGRPFEPKQIQKAFNEVYKTFNSTQVPMVVADFQLPGDTFDINVSPDKRMIMLHNESELVAALKTSIEESFASARSTYQVNDGKLSKGSTPKPGFSTEDTQTKLDVATHSRSASVASTRPAKKARVATPDNSVEEIRPDPANNNIASAPLAPKLPVQTGPPDSPASSLAPSARPEFIPSAAFNSPAKAKTVQAILSTSSASWNRRQPSQSPAKEKSTTGAAARSALREHLAGMALKGSQPVVEDIPDDEEEDELQEDDSTDPPNASDAPMDIDQAPSVAQIPEHEEEVAGGPVASKEPEQEKEKEAPRPSKKPRQRRPTPETEKRPTEFVKAGGRRRAARCAVDMNRMRTIYRTQSGRTGSQVDTAPACAGLISETNWAEPDAAQAELSLSRVIQKKDFLAMEILGQFNLGFVIARLRKRVEPGGELDDLFIIDQHAADEKFNFERLQGTTKIQSQRLIRPRLLELSIMDELTAIDNLEVLKKNGFVVQVDKDVPDGDRPKLRLAAQPMSKDTMFDMKDLEEILHQMQEGNSSETVRCTKARAMFAMRACRSSIMIGTALKQRHMVNMVRNLAGMDLPWNCPHGRPTMRHLCNLRAHSRPETPGVDWRDFSVLEV
ncbi:DNA mismatch repair protein MutL [Ceratobasidium sp. AG-Ba]|nr:DNA mismatch repair protein MutL [Ceratobasidium sp. AG-Ba]